MSDQQLRVHLGARHALANWRTAPDPAGYHAHEHAGPGTIRSHPIDDLSGELVTALAVEREMDEDEGVAQ